MSLLISMRRSCPPFATKPEAIADQEKSANQRGNPQRQPEPQEFDVTIHRNENNGATTPKQDQQQSNDDK